MTICLYFDYLKFDIFDAMVVSAFLIFIMYYALVEFQVFTDTVQNWFLVVWFLLMCSSALNWFLAVPLSFH